MNNSLKAFTVMELLVGMTLTAILLQLGFYAFQLVQKQFQQKKRISEKLEQIQFFESSLFHDKLQSFQIEAKELELNFTKEHHSVTYSFQTGFVIRYHSGFPNVVDTFWIQADIKNTFFQKEPLSHSLIDQYIIDFELFGQAYQIVHSKNYSAADLIQYFK